MECPNIGDISFSQTSLDAIEDLKRRKDLSNALVLFSGAGHIVNIFVGRSSLNTVYSLYSTDFELLAEALTDIPDIVKNRIETVAYTTYLNVGDYKEKQFWQAIYQGCRLN